MVGSGALVGLLIVEVDDLYRSSFGVFAIADVLGSYELVDGLFFIFQ